MPATSQYHVVLDGQGYLIDEPSYRKTVARPLAPKARDGDLGYADFLAPSVWAAESWYGGAGMDRWQPSDVPGYSSGPYLDPSFGDLRLGSDISSVLSPGSGTSTDLWALAVFGTKAYAINGAGGTNLYESSNGSSWSSIYAPAGPSAWRGLGTFNDKLHLGSSSNGEIHTWDGATGALWITFASTAAIDVLLEWSRGSTRKLYVGCRQSSRGQLHSATTGGATTPIFTTDYERISAMVVWDEQLWFAAISDTNAHSGALYRYDGTNVTVVARLDDNAITSFAVLGAQLYAASATKGVLWRVSAQGLTEVFRLPATTTIGGSSSYALDILQLAVFDERLYLPIVDSNGLGLYAWDGDDRHGPYQPTTSGLGTEPRGILAFGGRLLVSNKSASGARIYRTTLAAPTSATWVSSWFDADLAAVDKAMLRVTIRHDALAANESIAIDYALDESASFTSLGTSDVDGATSYTVAFAAGVNAKVVRFRLTISLTDTSHTPIIHGLYLEYRPLPTPRAEWRFDVLLEGTTELPLVLLDTSAESSTGAQLSAALWASKAKRQSLSFTDWNGDAKTVVMEDLEETIAPQSQRRGPSSRGRVTLVEA